MTLDSHLVTFENIQGVVTGGLQLVGGIAIIIFMILPPKRDKSSKKVTD